MSTQRIDKMCAHIVSCRAAGSSSSTHADATVQQVTMKKESNLSGNSKKADQGFLSDRNSASAPAFEPSEQADDAVAFFKDNGFVVLRSCLSNAELSHLNGFYDRTQRERPLSWGLTEKRKPHHRGQGLIFSQPLLDYPELVIAAIKQITAINCGFV